MLPKILMLANTHKPFDTRIFQKEARSLQRVGFDVIIITPHIENVVKDGVRIEAVPLAKGGVQQLIICPWRIFRKAMTFKKSSVIHLQDSELLWIGFLLKLMGRRVIYDAHEDTPLQINYQHWIPRFVKVPYKWFYYFAEKIAGIWFNGIIVAEPIIARYYPPEKTFLIRNFPLVSSFRNHAQIPYHQREKALAHIGLLSRPRGLFEMLSGSDLAQQEESFTFLLGGKFSPPSLQEEVIGKFKVDFLSWVEYDKLPAVLFSSRIGIIVPNPNPRYLTNYPVKMFEYMAAALPVIASKEGESARFVNESACGILVDPRSPEEIAKAIVWLFQHPAEAEAMGRRGQQMVFDKYNWEKESEALVGVYNRILKLSL